MLSSSCTTHLFPLLHFLSSDVQPTVKDLWSSFEHKRSLDLYVWSNLFDVLFQTYVTTGTAAVLKVCKNKIFAIRWQTINIYSYYRKFILSIKLSEMLDLDFNSLYISQHKVFLAAALKNNFRIDTKRNYGKHFSWHRILITCDRTCIWRHTLRLHLTRKASTWPAGVTTCRYRHSIHRVSCTCTHT